MPIEGRRLEAGIYIADLTGNVSLEELLAFQEAAQQEMTIDPRWLLILDMTRLIRMPTDLRGYRRVMEIDPDDELPVMLVGASSSNRLVTDTLSNLFPVFVHEDHPMLDTAVARARVLIAPFLKGE